MVLVQHGELQFIKINNSMKVINIANNHVPVYLVGDKGEWNLIEGGLSLDVNIIKYNLLRIVASPSEVKNWFILHSHYDHIGSLPFIFPLLNEVKVWANDICMKNLKKTHKNRTAINIYKELSNTWNCDKEFLNIENIKVGNINEFSKEFSKYRFTPIYTPGHSSCSMSLFEESYGHMFVSDSIGDFYNGKKYFPLFFKSIEDYLVSIHKLSNIDCSKIHFGHHESPFCTCKETYNICRKETLAFIDYLKKETKRESHEKVRHGIFEDMFPYLKFYTTDSVLVNSIDRIVELAINM